MNGPYYTRWRNRLVPYYNSKTFFDYRNAYVAREGGAGADFVSNQIHELGHQLARAAGLVDKNYKEEDKYGHKLEECVSGAINTGKIKF